MFLISSFKVMSKYLWDYYNMNFYVIVRGSADIKKLIKHIDSSLRGIDKFRGNCKSSQILIAKFPYDKAGQKNGIICFVKFWRAFYIIAKLTKRVGG